MLVGALGGDIKVGPRVWVGFNGVPGLRASTGAFEGAMGGLEILGDAGCHNTFQLERVQCVIERGVYSLDLGIIRGCGQRGD